MIIVAVNVLNLPITHLKPYCFLYVRVLRCLLNDAIKLRASCSTYPIESN